MAKATIVYYLSEKGRKDSILKGGDGKADQLYTVDVTPEILELARVSTLGGVKLEIVETQYKISESFFGDYAPEIVEEKLGHKEHDNVKTPEELIIEEQARRKELAKKKAELEKELPTAIKEWEVKKVEREKDRENRRLQNEIEQKAREDLKKAREQEKRDWILAHGSQYLNYCLKLGLKANLEYVVERTAHEYPGYTVDYTDSATWSEKFSPSIEAIEELVELLSKGAEAEIVWLTSPAKVRNDDVDDYDFVDDYEPCEAVVIRKFLGKYDLVKEF